MCNQILKYGFWDVHDTSLIQFSGRFKKFNLQIVTASDTVTSVGGLESATENTSTYLAVDMDTDAVGHVSISSSLTLSQSTATIVAVLNGATILKNFHKPNWLGMDLDECLYAEKGRKL
jgi:hypothetical protein